MESVWKVHIHGTHTRLRALVGLGITLCFTQKVAHQTAVSLGSGFLL